MYGRTPLTITTVVVATTGFAAKGYVFAAVFLIVCGALLVRWGRRRVATR
jgi:hypothetical protein